MSVNISKLWNNNTFNNLTNNSKLLYIYMITNNRIKSVGVLTLNIKMVKSQLSLSLEQIRVSTKELIIEGYIYVKEFLQTVYFIIPAHFNSLIKNDVTLLKITKDLECLPSGLREFLNSININNKHNVQKYIKPTKKEILDFAVRSGYNINADTVINHYQKEAYKRGKSDVWLNSRGKVVISWKATLRKVWFKDEIKIKTCTGAPKGFEYFYIEINGNSIRPDGWRNGKPYSKDFLKNKQLLKEFMEKYGEK